MSKARDVIKFPPDVCGVCDWSTPVEKEENYTCFVEPPALAAGENGTYWLRGASVAPTEPKCRHFKPRHHA